ncbi:MAG: SDR family oxidoreductase [Candidatus Binatia bacterium]|nr:SDR family oxidoreductase [Candidatus Binatia bacterium]
MSTQALAGKTAFITGGGTGIGYGCTLALLRDGATVTIAGRRLEVLEEAATALRAQAPDGAEVRVTQCDVTSEEEVTACVAKAANDGHLDIAIANAGGGFGAYILLTDAATFRQSLDLNILGSYNTIRAAAFAMKDSGGGSIIAMSSIAGAITHQAMPAYCTAKAGLDMLVRCAADELGHFGIRVNSIQPGITATDMMKGAVIPNEDVVNDYIENMPLGRVGEVEDVGQLARFLAGPESSWITGQSVAVDGGHTLRRGPSYDALFRPALGEDTWKLVKGDS